MTPFEVIHEALEAWMMFDLGRRGDAVVDIVASLREHGYEIRKVPSKVPAPMQMFTMKVWRRGPGWTPTLYSEDHLNLADSIPGTVRVGPYDFAGDAQLWRGGSVVVKASFSAGEVVLFDADDDGLWFARVRSWS